MKIAVVILNWNGLLHLQRFLSSVVEHSISAEIWIIDNASTDGSVSYIQQKFPIIKLIQLPRNEGYAGGYNQGLKQISADIYCLLNSDVEVPMSWLPSNIDLLLAHEKNAVCAPKILDITLPHFFEYAGAAGGFLDAFGFPFCRGRVFDCVESDYGQYNHLKNLEIFWASGACFFIKADIFHQEGGFDADFFAHMEEIDLCWRLKNRGYRILYNPESQIYHVGGGTLNTESAFKTYLNFRNNLYLIYKNETQLFFLRLFLRLFLDGIAAFGFLVQGKFSFFWAVLKAHGSFYLRLPVLYRQRKENLQKINFPNHQGRYLGSIVWDFFIQKKKSFERLKIGNFF